MASRRAPALLFLLLMLSTAVSAATLSGTAYTQDLQVARYALLTINTTPPQRIVLEDGMYNITVPRGAYLIRIEQNINGRLYDDELVVEIKDVGFIRNTGNYTNDFILFPSDRNSTMTLPVIEEENESEPSITPLPISKPSSPSWALILLPVALAAAVGFYFFQRMRRGQDAQATVQQEPAPIPADLDNVLQLIKREGGRTTQKELRKHMDCSEAKLSMMLTELEAKGKIEKIKKGRGNLIIAK